MMALEGPFLAAIIARLPDPKFNLAAYGVAFAFALLVEAPVIMMMSASTALVEDAPSFRKLRNFTYGLNAILTGGMLLLVVPPVGEFVLETLIGLPHEVARLTYWSLLILLPWPAAIGYRRFYQGLLIRGGRTRLVAYGTMIRLVAMSSTAFLLFKFTSISGAYMGAAALTVAVCVEAVASRIMVRGTLRKLLSIHADETKVTLDYRRIRHFYIPLALTSVIGLAVPNTPVPAMLAIDPLTPTAGPNIAVESPRTPKPKALSDTPNTPVLPKPVVDVACPKTPVPSGLTLSPLTPIVPPVVAVASP